MPPLLKPSASKLGWYLGIAEQDSYGLGRNWTGIRTSSMRLLGHMY